MPRRVGRADGQPLPADHALEPVRGVVRDHPPVVDHGDLVGERVGLLQVLRGEQHRRAVADEAADHVPHVLALGRVEARGGLVKEDHLRPADERRGEVKAAPHAAGVVLGHLVRGLGQVEPREQLGGALPRGALGQVKQLADHDQVLHAGQVLVDRGELAGQPDALPHLVGLLAHVEPVDAGGSRVGAQQRGEDADGGGLARAVRPEHGEDAAPARREVHPGEGLRLTEGLGKPRGFNR